MARFRQFRPYHATLWIVALLLIAGCATIVEGTDQYIDVQLSPDTAFCDISQKGSVIESIDNGGGQVEIPKSRHDIFFECSAEGYQDQKYSIESSASGWGVVGCFLIDLCITDYSTGALNKYPETINIKLKKNSGNVGMGQEQTAPSALAPPAAPTTVQPEAQRRYGVVFAAYDSAEQAEQGWSDIRGKHAQMLAGIQSTIKFSSLAGGQPRYHLSGEGLTEERAQNLCSYFKQQEEYCLVVKF